MRKYTYKRGGMNSSERRKMMESRYSKFDPEYSRLRNTAASRLQRRYRTTRSNVLREPEPEPEYDFEPEPEPEYGFEPEPEPEYDFEPEPEYGFDFNDLPIEIMQEIFGIDPDMEPNYESCQKIKKMCRVDPNFCRQTKIKEKYYEPCKKIRKIIEKEKSKTNDLINKFKNRENEIIFDSDSEDLFMDEDELYYDYTEDYPVNTYIDEMDLDNEMKNLFGSSIQEYVELLINKRSITHLRNVEIKWYELVRFLRDDNYIDEFLDDFGIILYTFDPIKYPIDRIERIKQKLLKEYIKSD